MTKSETTIIKFFMALCGALVLILGAILIILPLTESSRTVKTVTEVRREYVYDKFLTREKINDNINDDNYYYKLAFYQNLTGSKEVAESILDTSLEKDVPVNIAFALAFVESSFNPEAENSNSSNNTVDRGLFQLNSATFRGQSIDWNNPYESANHGLNYLNTKKDNYGSWESAIIMYNAGVEGNLSNRYLRYLSRILSVEREFDERFNTFRRNFNNSRDKD